LKLTIKILKNKSRRYENAFQQTHDEMFAIFEKKNDGEISDGEI
jgi:hypothetical protein